MLGGIKLGIYDFPDDASLVNNESDSARDNSQSSRDAKETLQRAVGIGDDWKWQTICLLEARGIALCRNGDYLRVKFGKILGGIPEGAALGGTAGAGTVGKVEDDVAGRLEGRESDGCPVCVGFGKVRGRLAYCDRHDGIEVVVGLSGQGGDSGSWD